MQVSLCVVVLKLSVII